MPLITFIAHLFIITSSQLINFLLDLILSLDSKLVNISLPQTCTCKILKYTVFMDLLSYENNKLELSITNTEKSAKTTNVKKKKLIQTTEASLA